MSIVAGLVGLVVVALIIFGVHLRVQKRLSGVDVMIGARGITLTPLAPEGRISYGGENWAAILEPRTSFIGAGSSVRIIAVEGLRLRVQPVYILQSNVDPLE